MNTDQGPLERVLRVGTVDFDTAGTDDSDFTFTGIADPHGDRHRRRSRPARAGPAAAALSRCFGDGDELYAAYHDDEWGRPVRDERGLFERLSLEAFQSGLSWLTILRKRDAFRAAFADFDPDVVATFGAVDAGRLLGDAGIVRNRLKIEATLANARATVALREAGTPLHELIAAHAPAPRPAPASFADVPGADGREPRAGQGAARRGLPLRRPDDALRADAGDRLRQRPPGGLPGARERSSQPSVLLMASPKHPELR